MSCRDLDAYLDRRVSPGRQKAFEEHLTSCPACREQVRAWRDVEVEIVAWAAEQSDFNPTPLDARRLVNRARAETGKQHAPRRRWVWAAGLAAATAGVLAVIAIPRLSGPPPEVIPSKPIALRVIGGDGTVSTPEGMVAGATLSAGKHERLLVQLGRDRIGVGRGARVEVVAAVTDHVRLRLLSGHVALEVEPRRRGERVEVVAGEVLVSVVGTRFMVSRRTGGVVDVTVAEGRVRVSGLATGAEEVGADQRLRVNTGAGRSHLTAIPAVGRRVLARTLRAASEPRTGLRAVPETVGGPRERQGNGNGKTHRKERSRPMVDELAVDELTVLRQWVVDGNYEAAERALLQRVAKDPDDGDAWSLLADCRRKAGRYQAAVKAYRRAMAVGNPAVANRARFMAASVLQDELGEHAAAVPLLEAYLAEGPSLRPLEAAGRVRLARSLRALGKDEAARAMLEGVVQEHPDTKAAGDARRMLDQ